MSGGRATLPVAVALRTSRLLDGAAVVMLLALLGVAVAAPSWPYALATCLAAVVLLMGWRAARSAVGAAAEIRLLERDSVSRWWLHLRGGGRVAARLDGTAFVTVPLVVLVFEVGGRRRSLVLLPDSGDRQCLRRLRVALRTAPGGGAPQSLSSGGA